MISADLVGIEGRGVKIEAMRERHPSPHEALVQIAGLADATKREVRVRVEAAINALGKPPEATSVKVYGATGHALGLDLPIALAVLGAESAAFGALSLSGQVQPARGAIAAAVAIRAFGAKQILLSPEDAALVARYVTGIEARACRTLADALAGGEPVIAAPDAPETAAPDFADCNLDDDTLRRLCVAAVARCGILLVAPPGAGKTMVARRIPGILPRLTQSEQEEVALIHNAAGLHSARASMPFRAPHHSTTPVGLTGGGAPTPRPGEVTLAHRGVLFLDEVTEFSRQAMEHLRQVMRDGEVVLSRASGTVRLPSNAMIVAATSACACGRAGSARACQCKETDRTAWATRIDERTSGLIGAAIRLRQMEARPGHVSSAVLRSRVVDAIDFSRSNPLRGMSTEASAAMRHAAVREVFRVDLNRTMTLALAAAALDGCVNAEERHVTEALAMAPEAAVWRAGWSL